jgi:putative acetyltransferase
VIIRDEVPSDISTIRLIVSAAFETAPRKSGTEAAIVDALRADGSLTLSLVAESEGAIIGHVAFSPVSIDGNHSGWFGLGPVSVINRARRCGIGKALVEAGIERLKSTGAQGCVVLGEPSYYGRFGFVSDVNLRFPGAPAHKFQRLILEGQLRVGLVQYHAAFYDAR